MLAPSLVLAGWGGAAQAQESAGEPTGLRVILEAEFWAGYDWRSGQAVNGSGPPLTEVEEFPFIGGGLLQAIPLSENVLLQIEIDGEYAIGSRRAAGGRANDSYLGSITAGAHLAYLDGPFLIGAFGSIGNVFISDLGSGGRSQDAIYWVAGGEGRVFWGQGSVAVQAGFSDVGFDAGADDSEVFGNAIFGRVIGQVFFNDGGTMMQGDFTYVDADQDPDDTVVNPLKVLAWGLEVEHALDLGLTGTAGSVFVSYQGSRIAERSTSGITQSVIDHAVFAGFRLRFGADTPYERERYTAPDLPNIARWLGSTPVVD